MEEILEPPAETSSYNNNSESMIIITEDSDSDSDEFLSSEADLIRKCRGCFAQEDEMSNLFTLFAHELTLAHIIKQCTGYSCVKGDGFPVYLCRKCTTVLVDFFNFKAQFEATTNHVENLLGKNLKKNIKIEPKEDHADDVIDPRPENDDVIDPRSEDNDVIDPRSKDDDKFMPDLSEISKSLGVDFRCKFCSSQFDSKTTCETHLIEVHKINLFTKFAIFRRQVEARMTSKEKPKIEQLATSDSETKCCQICKKKIPHDEFKSHCETHKVNVCKECGHKFIKKFDLIHHQQMVHSEAKNYTCHLCNKSFKIKSFLKRHIRLKHDDDAEEYVCAICEAAFNSKISLKRHVIRTHTENRVPSFSCNVCKSAFRDKSSLKRHHLIKHTSDFKRFSCDFCDKTYTSGANLQIHVERHHFLDDDDEASGSSNDEMEIK